MTRNELRDAFFDQLGPLLPGFRPRKKDEVFARKIAGGEQQVGLALVDYKPDFVLSLTVAIRLEEAETIFNAFSGSLPKYHGSTLTSATLLEWFTKGSPARVKVSSDAEIAAAVAQLKPVIEGRIAPFLEAHQDVESLDAVLNGPDGAAFDKTNPPYRQMHGLIVAKLAGNPRFEELAATFQGEAAAWQERDRAKLVALTNQLRTH